MADKSLTDLTKAIQKIADDSKYLEKHQQNVRDIRNAVVGKEGITGLIASLDERLAEIQKINRIEKVTSLKNNKFNFEKNLIKSTNNTNTLLGKILNQIQKIPGGGGGKVNLKGTKKEMKLDDKFRKLDGISKSIEIIERLRNLGVKDFIFAKTKLKHISELMTESLEMFRQFKSAKEMENTVSFANSSIDIVKKLTKISILSKPAELGINAIERVFFGGKKSGGLLELFRRVNKSKKQIEEGRKSVKSILLTCGALFLTTTILAATAVVGIPALLGALLLKGIISLLSGTFSVLNKVKKDALIGSAVLLIMSTSLITFGLGLGFTLNAVKGASWKDFGMMMASIGAIGLTLAGLGIPAVALFVGIGSAVLLGAGIALHKFAKSMDAMKNLDTKKSVENAKLAISSLREAFKEKLNIDNKDLRMLRRMGRTLRKLHKGLEGWDKFDGTKTASNITYAIGALKEAFSEDNNVKSKSVREMRLISRATRIAGRIRRHLLAWERFKPQNSISNLKYAITELKEVFGLSKSGETEGEVPTIKGDLLGMGTALMKNKLLSELGIISIATGISEKIRQNLMGWERYGLKNAVGNMENAISTLMTTFGLNKSAKPEEGIQFDYNSDILGIGTLLMKHKLLSQLGLIATATGISEQIRKSLIGWERYSPKNAVGNMENAITQLFDVFGLDSDGRAKNNEAAKSVQDIANRFLDSISNFAKRVTQTVRENRQGKRELSKLSMIADITSVLATIRDAIKPWESYRPDNTIKNIDTAITGITGQVMKLQDMSRNGDVGSYFKSVAKKFKKGLKLISAGLNSIPKEGNLVIPLQKTIEAINALDMSKVSVVSEMFKTFSKIKGKPVDRFTKAVDKFSESCTNLIESLNTFSGKPNEVNGETTEGETTNVNGGVNITNTQDLADAIANAIKSLNINVESNISDVRLVVNGESGRRVVLSLDN